MKTLKFYSKSIVILLLAVLSTNMVAAQTTKTEQVTKVYDINPTGSLQITSNMSDIEILTWDRNEVKIVSKLTYTFKGISEVDENFDKACNAFKNIKAESSKELLKLNLTLITSSIYNKKPFKKLIITNTLCNGDMILLRAGPDITEMIETAYTIWIPESLDIIMVNSKFGKFKMASVKGNVNFILHRNNLEMGNFGESGIFDINYSTVTIGSGGTSDFNAYNSRVNAAELKNLTIDAKYSNFNIAKADDVSLKSNSGTFVFGMLNNIDASANYSTIRIENNVEKSKFDFYQSKLFGKNFQTMEISSKFSEFNTAHIGKTIINTLDRTTFNVQQ